jgi:cation diffusion facilitator family transporter
MLVWAGAALIKNGVEEAIRQEVALRHDTSVLAAALVSMIISAFICRWEKGVGTRLQSQSLLANADESKMDILTSALVFVGVLASAARIPVVEAFVASGVGLLIIVVGAKHGRNALYVLLDASLDGQLEEEATAVARTVPGVLDVASMRLRRSGPFSFGIAHVNVSKSTDVNRAHQIAHDVQETVRERIPHLEALTVHIEPYHAQEQRLMIPSQGNQSLDSTVSGHFGRAPWFLIAGVSEDGSIREHFFVSNPFSKEQVRSGLDVVRELVQQHHVDIVLTREIGEIAFHALRDNYVEVLKTSDMPLRQCIADFHDGVAPVLTAPSHRSDARGAKNAEGRRGERARRA